MRHLWIYGPVTGLLLSLPVFADEVAPPSTPPAKPLQLILQAGLTFGGDTLATTYFTSGSSEDIDAGSLLYFGGGFNYRFSNALELRTTVNYFVNNTTAKNGSASFDRIPVEVTLGRSFGAHRLAAGVTRHFNPKLDIDFSFGSGGAEFDDATGSLLEYGYRIGTAHTWVTVRYVDINYRVSGKAIEFDGSHFGIGLATVF